VVITGLASLIGLIIGTREAVGAAMLAIYASAVIALLPMANELATTRPLIAALSRQHVAATDIALYSCPQLWSRDMPLDLERVRYVAPEDLTHLQPQVIATARKNAPEIASALRGYRVVETVQMIGKPFDVYRR